MHANDVLTVVIGFCSINELLVPNRWTNMIVQTDESLIQLKAPLSNVSIQRIPSTHENDFLEVGSLC